MLEKLSPIRTPDTNTREILVPGDTAVVRYRDFLKDWDARGWRLDYKALQAKKGDVAYAIPCPDRRSSGNWVLDTVPLIEGDAAALRAAAREAKSA